MIFLLKDIDLLNLFGNINKYLGRATMELLLLQAAVQLMLHAVALFQQA